MSAREQRPRQPMGPPRLARWILTLILPPRYRDNQIGDLAEEFRASASLEHSS